jgi:GNAT superfamily N-acetyltransferase
MIVKELKSIAEMMQEIELMREMYPSLQEDKYRSMLEEMVPHNYGQIAVYNGLDCVGICGYWLATKLWCGKYLEFDNMIVGEKYRSLGAGKIIAEYLGTIAKKNECNILVADAYTTNFGAHRFYYNQGFGPKGFHFVKVLNPQEIR